MIDLGNMHPLLTRSELLSIPGQHGLCVLLPPLHKRHRYHRTNLIMGHDPSLLHRTFLFLKWGLAWERNSGV